MVRSSIAMVQPSEHGPAFQVANSIRRGGSGRWQTFACPLVVRFLLSQSRFGDLWHVHPPVAPWPFSVEKIDSFWSSLGQGVSLRSFQICWSSTIHSLSANNRRRNHRHMAGELWPWRTKRIQCYCRLHIVFIHICIYLLGSNMFKPYFFQDLSCTIYVLQIQISSDA